MFSTPWIAKHDSTVQFLVQIESTRELNNTRIIVIKLLLHQAWSCWILQLLLSTTMIMLWMELSWNVHHLDHQINVLIKKCNRFSNRRPKHQVAGQMASRIHVLHAINRHILSTLTSAKSSLFFFLEHKKSFDKSLTSFNQS
jgi:hypothetical protein